MEDIYGFKSIIKNNIIKCSEDIYNFIQDNLSSKDFLNKLESSWKKQVKISFAIMTFNEERCIKRCIESINNFADEIIVIDTGSTDNTINIINSFFPDVKVYTHLWKNDFSYIRNLFSKYTSNDWIFQIDADEYFDSNDFSEVKKFICILENIPIEPKIISPKLIDHDYSETLHTKRIYKKNSKLQYHGLIHEELRYDNSINTPYLIISNCFFHDGYKSDIIHNKQKNLRNVSLLKKMIEIEPNNIRWYYFLARDSFTLEYPREYIQDILEKGLKLSEFDNVDFKTGILSRLMELNLDNLSLISKYVSIAKEINSNCMDTYYYELISKQAFFIDNIKNLTTKSINIITELDEPFSLINSNGDHLFLSWGWGYFWSQNYDLAFTMWDKIKSCDIRKKLDNDLMLLNNNISKFFDSK